MDHGVPMYRVVRRASRGTIREPAAATLDNPSVRASR